MLSNNWLKALRNRLASGSRTSLRRRRGKTGTKVQPLEQRSLLAATILFDDFESGALNVAKWDYRDAYVSSSGPIGQSGTYAARLNGLGEEFNSVPFNLSSYISANLSFSVQAGGNFNLPEVGDDLIVTHRLAGGSWSTLATISVSQVSSTSFQTRNITLPTTALHSAWELAFTAYGSDTVTSGTFSTTTSGVDDWFIDNVMVTANQRPVVTANAPTGPILAGSTTPLTWSATDPDGDSLSVTATVSRNGTVIHTSTSSTGSFSVSTDGVYSISVSASDGSASASASDSVTIDDDLTAPTISLGGIEAVQLLNASQMLTWSAMDASGIASTQVALVRNGVTIFTSTDASGTFDFESFGLGDYTVTVSTTDADNDRSNDSLSSQRTASFSVVNQIVDVATAGFSVAEGVRLVLNPTSMTVVMSTNMAATGAGSVTSLANWGLTRNGMAADSQLQSVSFGLNASTGKYEAVVTFAAALVPGDYVLTAKDTLTDANGRQLDGDANGTDGGDFTRAFQVRTIGKSGPEFRVNTFTTGRQGTDQFSQQSVAMDDSGNYVVTWSSDGQDGSGYGVYAQRFNAAGVAQGDEFRVNTVTAGIQTYSAVAMDADGDFVITWTSNGVDGSNGAVVAQRYNALGAPQGSNFQVNVYFTNSQADSSVAMDADGDFVISWNSNGQNGNAYEVYARKYTAAGVALTGEFRVNTILAGQQHTSMTAMDADGDFVIVWSSFGQDLSSYGVYAQRYNAAGAAQGPEFRVNTRTTGIQRHPVVAMDADGDFVVAWDSDGQDGSSYGVFAQRFNAAGVAQGAEFQVSSFTANSQALPSIAMDDDGDFVVTWNSFHQDGSHYGVYAQRFNRTGVPQESEFRVNAFTANRQGFPAAAMDADGDYVVAWTSDGQDGSGYGMYAQRFGTNATTVLEVTAVGDSVTQNETLVSVPQSLTVVFSNAMSTTGTGSVTNLANWGLTKNGNDASSLLQSVTFAFSTTTNRYEAVVNFTAALTPGDYVLTAMGTMINNNGFQLDGDASGTDGGDFTRAFQVRAIGGAGQEYRVNTYTTGVQRTNFQTPQTVAIDNTGNYVVTWISSGQDGSGYGVYAQRYNAVGFAQGEEFRVNQYTTSTQAYASVAMDADGDFVVTWASYGQDLSNFGIYARRYNAAGVALGNEFRVNTHGTNAQLYPMIGMDDLGGFVISWSSSGQDLSGYGVYAQRYNAAGGVLGTEFKVNTTTANDQSQSVVSMDADGDFVITWTSSGQDGSGGGVYAQRYNSAGVAQGVEFKVNTYTQFGQQYASVAMDSDGDFVVTWQSNGQDGGDFGVFAQRFNSFGVAQGGEFRVNSVTTGSQEYPTVSMDADGDFVVTWTSYGQDGSNAGIYAQRYNRLGVAVGEEFRVSAYTTNTQRYSSVSINSDGDFVVAWNSNGQDGSGYGIYAQRFSADDTAVRDVLAVGDSVNQNEQLVSAPQSLSVAFSNDMSTTGTGSVTNLSNWGLTKNGVDASSTLQSVTFGFNSSTGQYEALVSFSGALTPGDYVLTAKGTMTNSNGIPLDGDANGTDGGDFVRAFGVAIPGPAQPEYRVNSYTTGSQATNALTPQAVAVDSNGNYVITWTSDGQDGSGNGIYAQRYNAAGVALGNEFRVNTVTALSQDRPAVAMDADGDFVVTWTSTGQDGGATGVYAQRYNSSGLPQGDEFRVNTYTTNQQRYSSIAMSASGAFVISWSSSGQDGSGYGIYGQRYNAAGVAQGGEFKLNQETAGHQKFSLVTMDSDGDFIVTWASEGHDGSNYGVYARRYSSAGTAHGNEFLVNTYTTDTQPYSSVSMDANGDFVIVWSSFGQDGSDYGVYAQRYNAAGVRQGTEFRVNTVTADSQRNASVSMDADGDFVITWSSNLQDGNGFGIYARRYNSAGESQGPEFIVNTVTTDNQSASTVALDADGDFVIAWTSAFQDGNGNGVYARRFNSPDALVTDVLTLGDPVTANEQLISAPASLTVVFSNSMQTSGPESVTDVANWRLSRGGSDVSSEIQSVTFGLNSSTNRYEALVTFTAALTPGDYVLTAKDTLTDTNGRQLDGDSNGTDGGDFIRSFRVRQIAGVGGEFRVNTYTHDQQRTFDESPQSVAMDDAGNFVVTWASVGQDGSGYGVYAQRYNSAGAALGAEFRVNSFTTGSQYFSTVAMDADGDFVITWSSNSQDGSGDGVYARRYTSAGVALDNEFRVNTYTQSNQNASTVAMDTDGDFVVTWVSEGQDGVGFGIYAQRYNANGVAQGTEFRVNVSTQHWGRMSTIAMDADGDFVVTWSSFGQDASGDSIYARRFNAAGVAQGTEFRVNSYTTNSQAFSTVSMNSGGEFVITWSSQGQDGSGYGVYAQRYNAAGVAQGSEFQVSGSTSGNQRFAEVEVHADGDFVITWGSYGQDGSGYGIYAQRYNSAGIPAGSEFRVNSYTSSHQRYSTVAMDASGDFVVVWSSYRQNDRGWEVYAQRFEAVENNEVPVLTLQNVVSALPENTSTTGGIKLADIVVTDDGVGLNRLSLTGAQASFFEIVGTELRLKSGTVLDFELLSSYSVNVVVDDELLGRGAEGMQPFILSLVNLREPGARVGGEFRVNTFTTSPQRTFAESPQSVAMDDAGNYVVTWSSNGQDSGGYGIFAQRFNAAGVAQDAEFLVNTYTTNDQQYSTVAMDADGDFVISWSSRDQEGSGSGDGIYARRYNAAGVAQGGEFLVNAYTTSDQRYSTVAMDADGDFVITWMSSWQDGSSYGIYAQRYDSAGLPQGSEVRINTSTQNAQILPTVAMDADGDFVISWSGSGTGNDSRGIYAQRYDAFGVALGSELRVNTFATGIQESSSVAMDADGDFVISWNSFSQDGSGEGIYAQRFNASGVAQGAEFRVHSYTTSDQQNSTVAMDADGDFVIAWTSRDQDGSSYGIYAQRFNAAGVAQGAEFRVNTYTTSDQQNSTVAMDADGDFVIAWTGGGQDGSSYGVYAQRFDAAPPVVIVSVTSPTSETTPNVVITVTDTGAGILEGEPIVLDVDLNNDGDYADAGELNYASGTLTSGTATITLPALADGTYRLQARAYDKADNEGTSSSLTLVVNSNPDITAPISLITALPAASNSLMLNIAVTGNDPGVGASGILEYDLYYSTGGAFVKFATVPAGSPSTTFTGTANTTYWLRSLARDNAGNVETKISADTYTRFGDVVPPSTQVTTAVPTSSGLFTLQITGNKPSGTPITAFDVYVVIDGGEPILVGAASSAATGGGNYSGVILFQGILDGVSRTYRFFSRGRDGSGNVEAAPVSGDVSATYSFAAAGLTATAIDVQNGVNQRSYVRYLDVLFSTSTGLSDLLLTGRLKVERFGINATSVTPETGAAVTGFALVQNGNKLRLDFGSNGIGGLRQAGNGFYRVLLDLDGNGSFADAGDKAFEFHRLFGDGNGDATVDIADTNLVTTQSGRSGANLDGDLDGNGVVNSVDRLYTIQQRGQKLLDPLLSWLDD